MIPPYPRATYRLQLSAEMTFADAAGLVPYLSALGVSHLYTSPILAARRGSTHGYDIVDHNRLNPELGTEEEFFALVDQLHQHEMGLIVDFVPNHMGVGYSDNEWWLNVLEWGRYSPYASFFDIDWSSSEQSLRGKVLIPVLGDQYGRVLEGGELLLQFIPDRGAFEIRYYDHTFPIAPRHYFDILQDLVTPAPPVGESPLPRRLTEEIGELARSFRAIGPGKQSASRQAMLVRHAYELRSALARLAGASPELESAIIRLCTRWNGTVGDERSFDRLHKLLERQSYRLAYWRLASNEINYRRFFDINDLAAIRMEIPEVFEITHQLILRYIGSGAIQGLRLDHVDGLLDPKGYLDRLQEAAAYRLLGQRRLASDGGAQLTASIDQPLYVVVEKILARHETLRQDWQTSGTTGYDHMARVSELFFAPSGEEPLTAAYEGFTGTRRDFAARVLEAKRRTMRETLASELNVLANRLSRLAKRSRKTRDLSRLALRSALTEIVARFPVYRSYVDSSGPHDEDLRDIEWAVASARKAAETVDTSAYEFIHLVLTTEILERYPGEFKRREVVELAMKVQQFTAPVMAKSFEDTVFYRDARFIGRNEVGSEPEFLYISPQGFHYTCSQRMERSSFAMIGTATHDHKRGEDLRARLNVLSEIPDRWIEWTERFADYSGAFAGERLSGASSATGETSPADADGSTGETGTVPDLNDRYFLLQTILGAWPLDLNGPDYTGIDRFRERIAAYAIKAIREAKVHTSWTAVDEEYEQGVARFIDGILNPKRSATIVRFLEEIAMEISSPGAANALGQKLLTLTVPGVPDLYQGTERWDFSLVDPDNRHAVDIPSRRSFLEERGTVEPPDPAFIDTLCHHWRNGEIKQYIVARTLAYRRAHPDLFALGAYEPLEVTGEHADRIVAFRRSFGQEQAIVAVPRFLTTPLSRSGSSIRPDPAFWGDTAIRIPEPSPVDPLHLFDGSRPEGVPDGTDLTIPVKRILAHTPVALITAGG
ncbi:MAG: malto-oligosyltrehalose synthase [Alkalispirochaeta sp.]